MRETEIATPVAAPLPAAELWRAALKFVAAISALIGVSLLLASL